jgi:glucose/arabinose dehydrogenase
MRKLLTLLMACSGAAFVPAFTPLDAAPALKLYAEGFTAPTGLVELPDGSGRMLLADQVGTIHVIEKSGQTRNGLLLDVRAQMMKLNAGYDERGLLGLALHPKFQENGRFYLFFNVPKNTSTPPDWDCRSRLAEFKADPKTAVADPASERVLMEWDKPYFNHNGGSLAFGPDQLLYISVGDGGNANDVGRRYQPEIGNAQNTETYLGKILRIDVDRQENGKPYAIPADNPFVKGGGLPEIYAYGLRNPWRISFDRGGTHQLFAGDIGQTLYEEMDIIEKGGNYGWFIKEGYTDFNTANALKPKDSDTKVGLKGEPLIPPRFVFKNLSGFSRDPEGIGVSIIGGYIYRGKAIPELEGKYVFADYKGSQVLPRGRMMVSQPTSDGSIPWKIGPLALEGHADGHIQGFITSFGEDNAGELYVLVNQKGGMEGPIGTTGKVYKLVPN